MVVPGREPAVGAVARRVTQNVGSGVRFALITDVGVSGNLDIEPEDVARCRDFGVEGREYGDDLPIKQIRAIVRHNLHTFSKKKTRSSSHTHLPLGLLNVIAEYLPSTDVITLPFCGPVLFVDRDDVVYRVLCERLFPNATRTGSWYDLFLKRIQSRPQGSINIGSLTYIISGTMSTYEMEGAPSVAGAWGIGIGESAKVGIFKLGETDNQFLVIEIFVSETHHDEKSIITSIIADTTQMLQDHQRVGGTHQSEQLDQHQVEPQATSCKVVVIGAGNVGKSALSVQYVQDTFVSDYDPNICDTYKKQDKVDSHTCFMEVVDMAGQDEYAGLRSQYYRKGDGFLGVYSVTDADSLEEVKRRYKEVLMERNVQSAPLVLVANKCDLDDSEREVSSKLGELAAADMNAAFFETSAKERMNVSEAFHQLVRAVRIDKGEVAVKSNVSTDTATKVSIKESFDLIHERVQELQLRQFEDTSNHGTRTHQHNYDCRYYNQVVSQVQPPPPPPRRKRRFSKSLRRKRKSKCVLM
eukprot:TRINITY_DN13277_c3_g1_i3.p1 TRINITY_DN13277_c3_g1~~TRINITY_DN13277_c3_g1_i3.p1  ORF type:complete len:526 (+),score=73.14 TRINITY_DN13277_c3_g1_i3:63-1640(+)